MFFVVVAAVVARARFVLRRSPFVVVVALSRLRVARFVRVASLVFRSLRFRVRVRVAFVCLFALLRFVFVCLSLLCLRWLVLFASLRLLRFVVFVFSSFVFVLFVFASRCWLRCAACVLSPFSSRFVCLFSFVVVLCVSLVVVVRALAFRLFGLFVVVCVLCRRFAFVYFVCVLALLFSLIGRRCFRAVVVLNIIACCICVLSVSSFVSVVVFVVRCAFVCFAAFRRCAFVCFVAFAFVSRVLRCSCWRCIVLFDAFCLCCRCFVAMRSFLFSRVVVLVLRVVLFSLRRRLLLWSFVLLRSSLLRVRMSFSLRLFCSVCVRSFAFDAGVVPRRVFKVGVLYMFRLVAVSRLRLRVRVFCCCRSSLFSCVSLFVVWFR